MGSFASAVVNASTTVQFQYSAGALITATVPVAFGSGIQLTSAGSAAFQANWVTAGTVSVTNGTPVVLNLNTLVDPQGDTFTAADIMFAGFWNTTATLTYDITIGGGSDPVVSIWGSGNLSLPAGPSTSGTGGAIYTQFNPNATAYVINLSTACKFTLTCAAGTATVAYCLFGH